MGIPEHFSDKGPDDPKNVIGALHAQETAQRKRRPVFDSPALDAPNLRHVTPTDAMKRRSEPLPDLPPVEHQIHYAPEVRARRFFPLVFSGFILLLVGVSAVIFIPALPKALGQAQTINATYATLPTQTPTTTPTRTPRPTLTSSLTVTLSRTPTRTNTPTPTQTLDFTATIQEAKTRRAWQADIATVTSVAATVTAMSWTATPTITPTPTATLTPTMTPTMTPTPRPVIPFTWGDSGPTQGALTFPLCLQVGVIMSIAGAVMLAVRSLRAPEEAVDAEYQKAPESAVDDDTARLRRAVHKRSDEARKAQAAETAARQTAMIVMQAGAEHGYAARTLAEHFNIGHTTASKLTAWLRDNGALEHAGATPQQGYRRPLGEDGRELSVNETMDRLSPLPPPPILLEENMVRVDGQTRTADTDRHGQTAVDTSGQQFLIYDSDGKPIRWMEE